MGEGMHEYLNEANLLAPTNSKLSLPLFLVLDPLLYNVLSCGWDPTSDSYVNSYCMIMQN